MYKRNGIYYFSYNGRGGKYGMGDNPYGPFTYKGVVNANRNTGAQDHHSMLEYYGKWYFFYHVGNYNGGTLYRRNVSVDYLYHNPDGTMKTVVLTSEGVDTVMNNIKPDTIPKQIELENFIDSYGVQVESSLDIGGGKSIGYIDSGDWVEYLIFNPRTAVYNFDIRYATASNGGALDILIDGVKISTIEINGNNSNGWQDWQTQSTTISLPQGKHQLKLLFNGNIGGLFNLNWISFLDNPTSILLNSQLNRHDEPHFYNLKGEMIRDKILQ